MVSSSSLTFFLRGGSEWMDVQVLGVNREAEEKAGRQQQARRGDKMYEGRPILVLVQSIQTTTHMHSLTR